MRYPPPSYHNQPSAGNPYLSPRMRAFDHQEHMHIDMRDEFREVRSMTWRFLLIGLAALVVMVSIVGAAVILVVRALT